MMTWSSTPSQARPLWYSPMVSLYGQVGPGFQQDAQHLVGYSKLCECHFLLLRL